MRVIHIIYHENKHVHSRILTRHKKDLNLYQTNVFQISKFINKTKSKRTTRIFYEILKTIKHSDFSRFSQNNFKQTKMITKAIIFTISCRGQTFGMII